MGSWLSLGGGQPVLASLMSLWTLSGIGCWDGCTLFLSHPGQGLIGTQGPPGAPSAGLPPPGLACLAIMGHGHQAGSLSPTATSPVLPAEHTDRGIAQGG